MKLLGSTENKIIQGKSSENVPRLEITEVALVHCDIVKNVCQQYSRVFYTFVLNKPFGSLLEIYATNHIFLKTFNSVYDKIKVSFTDQNIQPLEIEDRINLTMMIKWRLYKNEIEPKELHNNDETKEEDVEITTHKKDIYLQKKDNKLLMN